MGGAVMSHALIVHRAGPALTLQDAEGNVIDTLSWGSVDVDQEIVHTSEE